MIAVVSSQQAAEAIAVLDGAGHRAWQIGHLEAGSGPVGYSD
jgi:phosphoribosylaminoimidazole (AIR) synthetase